MAQAVSVSHIARNILKLIMSDPPSQNDKDLNSGILITSQLRVSYVIEWTLQRLPLSSFLLKVRRFGIERKHVCYDGKCCTS